MKKWAYSSTRCSKRLKIPAHGGILQDLVPGVHHLVVLNWLNRSRLHDLQFTLLKTVNHELISALVERWHPETSSCHPPFGEMTITLDDVSNLLHLPLTGSSYNPPGTVDIDTVVAARVESLGILQVNCALETTTTKGPYFRFKWLEEDYSAHIQAGNWVKFIFLFQCWIYEYFSTIGDHHDLSVSKRGHVLGGEKIKRMIVLNLQIFRGSWMPCDPTTSYGICGRTTGNSKSISKLCFSKAIFVGMTLLYLTCWICASISLATSRTSHVGRLLFMKDLGISTWGGCTTPSWSKMSSGGYYGKVSGECPDR